MRAIANLELGFPGYDDRSLTSDCACGFLCFQMIIKVSCSLAAFVLNVFDLYGEGDFNLSMG